MPGEQKIKWGDETPDQTPTQYDRTLRQEPKQRVLTEHLGLPEDLSGRRVLELFSGSRQQSFRQEIVYRGGNYTSVDWHETTGSGHIVGDAYEIVQTFTPHTFDFVIMNGPPIWHGSLTQSEWQKVQRTGLIPHILTDLNSFLRFLSSCSVLITPRRHNKVAIASGFTQYDLDAIVANCPAFIPQFNNWYISTPTTGDQVPLRITRNGQVIQTVHFPDHALQLVHM